MLGVNEEYSLLDSRILILLTLLLVTVPHLSGQEASKKQSRQERKTARRLAQYENQQQALRDTAFRFQTEKILYPYIASNGTGGYLQVDRNSVRVQYLDWLESVDTKKKMYAQAPIIHYTVTQAPDGSGWTLVEFSCQLETKHYIFTIQMHRDNEDELSVRQMGGKTMKYSGKVRQR